MNPSLSEGSIPIISVSFSNHSLQIGKLGLSPKKYLTQKNPSKSSCSNCRMEDYFKDVDPKMLSELKELYRVDFEMFGYDFKV